MYYVILQEIPFPLPTEKSNLKKKNQLAIIMKKEERGGADETVFVWLGYSTFFPP